MEVLSAIENRGYVHPEVLVTTDWLAGHLDDPTIRIVESNEDPLLYTAAHIPGAVEVDWVRDLNDPVRRDYLDRDDFADLMNRCGIGNETTVVFYGDKNNWWATYAFWVFHLFGHQHLRILDGGRIKWEAEGRPMTTDIPQYPPAEYHAHMRNDRTDRAMRDQVVEHVARHLKLVDVRSPDEYSGLRTHMEGYPNEGALRGGHIPGARNIPWARAVNPDATFKSADDLRAIYHDEAEVREGEDVIVYCRIGERSSHTWFVLKYLLGYRHVRNYDGSWTEWGNLVGVPIEKDV
ncbi:MAG TPA: sulfurtransferase [Fimbriimonadaceae bacterium]|nr:sulfurtransferase [Fimbriimonadaceae bacterium]HRJ97053.1 sulfurtransferase [Fimbriimonadaceae bacterium]